MIVIVFSLCLVILFYMWYVNCLKYKDLNNLPGPPPNLIFGNALDFLDATKVLKTLLTYRKKYGRMVKVKVGPLSHAIMASDHKFFEFIFTSQESLKKSVQYTYLSNWLADGLLLSQGKRWRTKRKLISPTFHFSILEKFLLIFESVGGVLVDKLKEELNNDGFDVYHYLTRCTLDGFCETAMGTKINTQINGEHKYLHNVETITSIIVNRTFSAIESNDFLYRFTSDWQKEKKAVHMIHSFVESVIDKAIKEQNTLNEESTNEFEKKKNLTFIDILLNCKVDGIPLSKTEIRQEVNTFMFAGFETSATTITFALYCLASNPEVQQKVFEEQMELFGKENIKSVTASFKNIQDMKYLDMVIKEVLRLYPPIPCIGREISEDVYYDGMLLPKGLSIMLFPFAIHRDEDYFPEPEIFKPERFETQMKHNFSYVPFSAGPKSCLGQRFAVLVLKSIISRLVRSYEIFPVKHKPIKLNLRMTLTSETGVHIHLKDRILNK